MPDAMDGSHGDAIFDNVDRRRFELQVAGGTAFVDYHYRDGGPEGAAHGRVRVLTHAEVPARLRGAGVGARLVGGALELMRSQGQKVVPSCPYVARYIRRHAQYADLLAGAPGSLESSAPMRGLP